MATFITSKSVGQTISIYTDTSTGYWKYNHNGLDSSVFANGRTNNIPVTNANGEFTIMSCDSDGTVNGDVTILYLGGKQITSFNGTGLSSLITLELNDNQLTSFDGTGLSSLTRLVLESNLLTSFDGNGLPSLTQLALQNNLITSFDGTGLSSLNSLYLGNNLLTIFDITGLSSLQVLYLNGNPMTPSANNQILQQLNQLSVSGGVFGSNNGRTAESNSDYNNLVSLGWSFSGLDLPIVGNGKLRIKGLTSGGGTPPQVTHDELNANINGPSVLFRTHDFSMTMVQDGGKNDGKYSIHLDGKPLKPAMLQLNVGTPSAPCDSQYNDIVVAAIVFNSASTALAFKSNNNWPNGNVINFDNRPDINNEINEWGYFEGNLIFAINGDPANINSYPDDAKIGEYGNDTTLANSGYGPSDLDKIIIVICERDRATSQTVQYFEKWFAFELVGPEVYPNGWV